MLIFTWIHDGPLQLAGEQILEHAKRRADDFAEPYRTICHSIPNGTKMWHGRLSSWAPVPFDNLGGLVTLAGDAAHPMTFRE